MIYNYFNNIKSKNLNIDLPEWCNNQIQEDLKYFNKYDMSNSNLEKIMQKSQGNSSLLLVRFKIVDNKLFYYKGNTFALLRHDNKRKVTAKYKYICSILYRIKEFVKNVDFIISLQDYCLNDEIQPIFTFAKDLNKSIEKYNILIPDWLTLRGKHKDSWNNLKTKIDKKKKIWHFNQKENKIIWRGSLNTAYRKKFSEIAKKNKNYINNENNFIKQQDHLKYKYQIVFDGCRCTWPGYLWRLYSGCLTIKHESTQVQWFYGALKENIHYVSLKKDFEEKDLIELCVWLNKNQEKCKKISDNAEKFIIDNMSVESMLSYYINLLNEYADIQCTSENTDNFSSNFLYFNNKKKYKAYLVLSNIWNTHIKRLKYD